MTRIFTERQASHHLLQYCYIVSPYACRPCTCGIFAPSYSSLLVSWKDKIIPVKIEDIALVYIEYRTTKLVTSNNQKYAINYNLEELEEICGDSFYRANRQYLINRECISEASHYGRKLILKLKVEGEHDILIGKNRVPEFLTWLRS